MRLLLFVFIAMLFSGCYTQKKASFQADKANLHYPAMMAEKTRLWYPCITKDSTTDQEISFDTDSSWYWQQQADSLLQVKRRVKDSLAIRYKDSCRSVQDNFNQGYKLGYDLGSYDARKAGIHKVTTITTRITLEDMAAVKAEQARREKAEQLAQKTSSRLKVSLWFNLGLILLSAILILIIIKRR